MFHGCKALVSLPDVSKWITNNITNLFKNRIIRYSNIDTKNTSDMSYMFYICKELVSLPDISNWDTNNVKYITSIFEGCYLNFFVC